MSLLIKSPSNMITAWECQEKCVSFFRQIEFSYFCISDWNLELTISWFLTIAQFGRANRSLLSTIRYFSNRAIWARRFRLGRRLVSLPCGNSNVRFLRHSWYTWFYESRCRNREVVPHTQNCEPICRPLLDTSTMFA